MKSLPVTHKATRSPLKMSGSELVANSAQVHKKFVDAGGYYAEGRKEALDEIRADQKHKASMKGPKEKPRVPEMADTSGIDTKEATKVGTQLAVKAATGL
jgi:hypothetical protein